MSAAAFADPSRDSQAAFRAILDATARPGTVKACGATLTPPAPLCAAAAAALLTLADFETPLWLAPAFAGGEAAAWLKFHTGAPLAASAGKAAFALVDAAGFDLARFAQGTADYPDRSTTVILQLDSLRQGDLLRLAGPGVRGEAALQISPLPRDFLDQWAANGAAFPLGVDLILAAGAEIAALPRSTRIARGAGDARTGAG
jgi:alpha-D-ribose 1-methylphosphonate 5-triphosphate synthase subunit PhnH